jgi:hypothetical protein
MSDTAAAPKVGWPFIWMLGLMAAISPLGMSIHVQSIPAIATISTTSYASVAAHGLAFPVHLRLRSDLSSVRCRTGSVDGRCCLAALRFLRPGGILSRRLHRRSRS